MARRRRLHITWRGLGGVIAALVVSVAGLAALVIFLGSRDKSTTAPRQRGAAVAGPGRLLADRGDRHLAVGSGAGARDVGAPPASGAHAVVAVRRDEARLSDDQILSALEPGNVVLVYGSARSPTGLRALARSEVGGPFAGDLVRTGQAVILARRPGTAGILTLAWRRELRVASARDAALSQFIEAWLGRGAADRR